MNKKFDHRELITSAAFHRLRQEKKRLFRQYCRRFPVSQPSENLSEEQQRCDREEIQHLRAALAQATSELQKLKQEANPLQSALKTSNGHVQTRKNSHGDLTSRVKSLRKLSQRLGL